MQGNEGYIDPLGFLHTNTINSLSSNNSAKIVQETNIQNKQISDII